MKKILIDFEKSKDPFSGLGQYCLFLKDHFESLKNEWGMEIEYFMPTRKKLYKYFPFLIPYTDVFHGIHQDTPFIPWNQKTKYILTIHDFNAIYENSDAAFKKSYLKKLQKKVNRANAITFISEFTKNEANKYLNLKNKKLEVIYNGISLPENAKSPLYVPLKKYLFVIGTVLPKKNFHVLIAMMENLPDYELIIAGTTFHQYAKNLINEVNTSKLNKRIHFVGTITNEEKLWYYKNATAFMFPSLLEGFGLPVAEAQSLGIPLFLSKHTSLPEVGGPDAYYFENFDGLSMANFFQASIKEFNDSKKENLINYSKKFNWEKAAKQYLDLYTSL